MDRLLIPISFITFLTLGYDKLQAKADGRRIPEKVLLLMGVFGGAIGGLVGMKVFRHKTRHSYFWIIYTLSAVVQLLAVTLLAR
jgi:uncharacterized membrane protein YsdA (DUF1294 family)